VDAFMIDEHLIRLERSFLQYNEGPKG